MWSFLYEERDFGKWYTTYNVGLIFTAITMMWRGILQVKGLDFKGLNHIAGLAHAILGVGLIWFMIILGRQLKSNENNPCKN